MRVFVTGATGFIGRALIPRLQRDGHAVVAWVRSPARARGLLGAEVELVQADAAPDALVAAIERADAVVNLAGEPLIGGRWTAGRREILEDSRIKVTEQLVAVMAKAKTRPRVFISGSAVGYYGDRADEPRPGASRPDRGPRSPWSRVGGTTILTRRTISRPARDDIATAAAGHGVWPTTAGIDTCASRRSAPPPSGPAGPRWRRGQATGRGPGAASRNTSTASRH